MWNALDADLKTLSFKTFKARLKENFTVNYEIKQLNKHLYSLLLFPNYVCRFSIICKSLMIRLKYAM